VLAGRWHHRVEHVDGLAVAEFVVRVALNGDSLGVPLYRWGGPSPGVFQVTLGSFELLLGDVGLVSQGSTLPAWRGLESMVRGAVAAPCFHRPSLGVV
jgi:hypothetical protein